MTRADLFHPPYRQLDQQTCDGLEITLYWNASNDTLAVNVEDLQADDGFALLDIPGKDAYEAFNNPMTYHYKVEDHQFV
jgi:hypothetical protein